MSTHSKFVNYKDTFVESSPLGTGNFGTVQYATVQNHQGNLVAKTLFSREDSLEELELLFILDRMGGSEFCSHLRFFSTDLKGHQVLFFGAVKITDFGFAQPLDIWDNRVDRQHVGTTEFLHPYMFEDVGMPHASYLRVDGMIDYWGLMVSIWWLVTGSYPFGETPKYTFDLLRDISDNGATLSPEDPEELKIFADFVFKKFFENQIYAENISSQLSSLKCFADLDVDAVKKGKGFLEPRWEEVAAQLEDTPDEEMVWDKQINKPQLTPHITVRPKAPLAHRKEPRVIRKIEVITID
ncbi:hypothetical protein HDE_09794 [Halotydeus destructor]|nr:hypothetical protein HDE_09794 [Halotydeus destructor]